MTGDACGSAGPGPSQSLDMADWIRGRAPRAPGDLEGQVVREVEAVAGASTDASEPVAALTEAALRALHRAMAAEGGARAAGFDLLVADGLVTYACEAAALAEDPASGLEKVLAAFRKPETP